MTKTKQPAAPAITPSGIDHLLYACSNLEQGMDEIESLLGVRPVRGGQHPRYGTHNALLSFGPGVYLEIIARDPNLPAPHRGVLIDILSLARPRLVTWVYRAAAIEAATSSARNAGICLGDVESGSRTAPDGSEICWQLTDPYANPLDGAIPFLINWGNTVHPSVVAPLGGELVELSIEHPQAVDVRRAMSVLGAGVDVIAGDCARLKAKIATAHGEVVLS